MLVSSFGNRPAAIAQTAPIANSQDSGWPSARATAISAAGAMVSDSLLVQSWFLDALAFERFAFAAGPSMDKRACTALINLAASPNSAVELARPTAGGLL
jgi:hypothetical protein